MTFSHSIKLSNAGISSHIHPVHNQCGHWRCDYDTELVLQEKSYKTNLPLFSAYAGVVWRSVNKNNCIFSERRSYMVIVYPFSSLRRFISNSPIVLHHAIWRTVLIIGWFQWQRQGSWSQRLTNWFVQILKELTKSRVFFKVSTRYEKQEKWICHRREVNNFFIL